MSEELPEDSQGKMIVFGGKEIRRKWVDGEWYFSVVDIVGALTDSDNPRDYWYRMKRREMESCGIELSTLCRQLKLKSADGKSYKTEAANTQSAFRIIQSTPSPKAEPFKRWLAEVGYQRVQEIENPELAQQRMRQLYAFATPHCINSTSGIVDRSQETSAQIKPSCRAMRRQPLTDAINFAAGITYTHSTTKTSVAAMARMANYWPARCFIRRGLPSKRRVGGAFDFERV